jgi:hypothetical protein
MGLKWHKVLQLMNEPVSYKSLEWVLSLHEIVLQIVIQQFPSNVEGYIVVLCSWG